MKLKPATTPSQTVGPFFHPALLRSDAMSADLIPPGHGAEAVVIEGIVLDGESNTVPDAGIEIWQADEHGRYWEAGSASVSEETFIGYGRTGTDDEGKFQFRTIKPGRVRFDDTRKQAPHICVTVYARGLLNHLVTRIYFEDEASNDDDPILQIVAAERRETLIARRIDDVDGMVAYRFEINLQGERETVFFNV